MSDKVNILLVDDRPEKLLALEAVLEELGQEIVRAYSGRDALRALLSQDFAVILLDVNMPGMDGFETAQMIRQRPSTRDVPIIFVTAYGDETHVARGYSLGAVDYIHAPVVPEVLRSKVAVFVDLFKKTQQVKRQAESLRRRAAQLQKLAQASVVISSAQSLEGMLQSVTDAARDVIGSHQAITVFTDPQPAGPTRRAKTQTFSSFSPKYAEWRNQTLALDEIATTAVFRSRTATRLSEQELLEHPDWDVVQHMRIPPIKGGMLAAPLSARDDTHLGVIYLCDREDGGTFSADDEMVAVQLAQMASIAIENLLFAEEREANRIKDEFLSMLSHELRTPLNAILGWTQLLRYEHKEGELAHGLEVIERNARAQAKLVEDMLDVSRVTSGKLRLARRPIELEPIIRSAVDAIQPDAEGKGLSLQCVVDQGGIVNGDADRLQQVVWNLLSNSVKFTTTGGRVEVRLDRVNDSLRIRVADTGRGISPSFLPHVFDRFRQADSSSTRKHGGLGIGLTIVRQIVELHGGSVSADSPGEGRGATFSVVLPVCQTPDAHVGGPVLVRDDVPQHLSPQRDTSDKSKSSSRAPEPPPMQTDLARDLSGLRVLVVDDAPDTLEFVAETLRLAHADVLTATSVTEGLTQFSRHGADAIITDIAMPDRDGFDLIRAIRDLRASSNVRDVPAIALTAYAREDDRLRALAAGFRMHLAKPIRPSEIVDAVRHVTGRSGHAPYPAATSPASAAHSA